MQTGCVQCDPEFRAKVQEFKYEFTLLGQNFMLSAFKRQMSTFERGVWESTFDDSSFTQAYCDYVCEKCEKALHAPTRF